LAFPQLTQPGALDSANVDEHIFVTTLRLDKPITFLSVEPLHGSAIHETPLFRDTSL
jgi:hypothetical protein